MKKNKIIGLVVFFLVFEIVAIVGGCYAGGAVFLKITHIDQSVLNYHTLYDYYLSYKDNKDVFKFIQLGIGVGVLISLIPIAFVGIVLYAVFSKKEELHGSARLANDLELSKSGLFPTPAKMKEMKHPCILIGKMPSGRFKGQYIRFYGQQFLYISAPTRSGKGVGIIIPNLLNYSDSVVVFDVKKENFIYTAGFRKKCGQDVYIIAPDGYSKDYAESQNGVLRSHRWNPLSYISRDPKFRNADILMIAETLYPLTGNEDSDMWNRLAGDLFKGLVLYMLDIEDENQLVTLPNLLKLTSQGKGLAEWMQSEIELAEEREQPLSEDCVAAFRNFMTAPEKTRGSIFSNLIAPLNIFRNATCAAVTSGDDFDLRDVRRKKMSIYFALNATSVGVYSKLVNLFFSQLIHENTKVLPEFDPSLKYQCLMVLDEFPAMGRVKIIEKSSGYTAGYNMRYMIICQSKSQLEDKNMYGKEGAKTIIDNCGCQIIYPPKEVNQEVKDLSETIGYKTVKSKSKSRSTGKSTTNGSNISDQRRAVMLPQEIVELGKSEDYPGLSKKEIVVLEKVKIFTADKIIYFDKETESAFLERKIYSQNHLVDVPELDFSQCVNLVPIAKREDELVQ